MKGGIRCRLHGGFRISGAKTDAGRARIAEAQRKAWAAWRAQLGLPPEWRSQDNRVSKQKRQTAAQWLAANKREGEE